MRLIIYHMNVFLPPGTMPLSYTNNYAKCIIIFMISNYLHRDRQVGSLMGWIYDHLFSVRCHANCTENYTEKKFV